LAGDMTLKLIHIHTPSVSVIARRVSAVAELERCVRAGEHVQAREAAQDSLQA